MLANKLSLPAIVVISVFLSFSKLALAQETSSTAEQLQVAVLAAEAHFDSNNMALTPGGSKSLQGLVDKLDALQEILSIRIVGHTDSVGSAAANEALSLKRANFIREYFASKYAGVNLVVVGAGEVQPMASNDTAEGRRLNRRVEIQVIGRGVPPASISTN